MLTVALVLMSLSATQTLTVESRLVGYPNGWIFAAPYNEPPVFGDFNGDGIGEVLRPSADRSFMLTSLGDGPIGSVFTRFDLFDFGSDRVAWRPFAGDFTGDGSDDLVWLGVDRVHLHESSGTLPNFGWFDQNNPSLWRFDGAFGGAAQIGDFNGDGIADVARPSALSNFILFGDGSGGFDGLSGNYNPVREYNTAIDGVRNGVGDFDGDGDDDLLWVTINTIDVVSVESGRAAAVRGTQVPNGWTFFSSFNTPLSIGDFNGDGLDDLVRFSESQIWLFLSTGTSFTAQLFNLPNDVSFLDTAPRLVGDFNGDGIADLARTKGNKTFVYLGAPGGLWKPEVFTTSPLADPSFPGVIDVDGNGTDDIVFAGVNQMGVHRFFASKVGEFSLVTVDPADDVVTVMVQLKGDGAPAAGIAVRGRVEDSRGGVVLAEIDDVTDVAGLATFTWPIDGPLSDGLYTIRVETDPNREISPTTGAFRLDVGDVSGALFIPALLPHRYGDPSFLLPLEGASNATVTTQGPCTNVGTTITATGAGQCTITATANDGGTASPSASAVLSIAPARLTVFAEYSSMTWSDALPSYDVHVHGFVGQDNLGTLDGELVIDGPTTAVGVGIYPLTPGGLSSDNYEINFVPGSLYVEPAPLVVSVSRAVSVYGAGPVAVDITCDGLVNGDTAASLEIAAEHSAGDTPDAGVYPVTITEGLTGNYDVFNVDGTITVNRATLLVGVADAVMAAGNAVPDPVVTYLGFQYDDDVSLFSPAPVVTVTEPASPGPGSYERKVLGADHPNYQTIYDAGQLLVVDADLAQQAATAGCSSVTPVPAFGVFFLGLLVMRRRTTAQA